MSRTLDQSAWLGFGPPFNVNKVKIGRLMMNAFSSWGQTFVWFKVSKKLGDLLRLKEVGSRPEVNVLSTDDGKSYVVFTKVNNFPDPTLPLQGWSHLKREVETEDIYKEKQVLEKTLKADGGLELRPHKDAVFKWLLLRSIDSNEVLLNKMEVFELTKTDFETGRAYDSKVWTPFQRHGIVHLRILVKELKTRDRRFQQIKDKATWTDACILRASMPMPSVDSPLLIFESTPKDTLTLTTDGIETSEITVLVVDAANEDGSPWFFTGLSHLSLHFHRIREDL